jgi:ATP-dependent RNA helicase DeaD
VKLAHEASGAATADEEEIPEPSVGAGKPRFEGGRDRPARPAAAGGGGARMAKLFIGAGRTAGIRPQDLVGAIANETRLSGRDIGAIQISERFSIVEVPEASADEVIAILRGATIKGRRPPIRRDRGRPS